MPRRRLILISLLSVGILSCAPPTQPAAGPTADPAASVPEAEPAAEASAEAEPAAPEATPADSTRSTERPWTPWKADPSVPLAERSAHATERRSDVVKALFAQAGLAFPPAELYFRAFKRELELEVWASSARGGRMIRVATYEICGLSGDLGPKRAEGDRQVPEGFYVLQYYWPSQGFLLEMNVSYPNASDRALARGAAGGAIMIHGACGSIGCLAVGDERVEELWTMATAVHGPGRRVHVHIFPTRAWSDVLADEKYARHWPFWRNIKQAYDAFETTHHQPRTVVDWQAKYIVTAAGAD